VNKPQRLWVFMSYRREDTKDMAGRLSDRIATWRIVDEVFRDVDAIRPSEVYRQTITAALERCNVLIALIGPAWLTAVDENGRRRLDDPADLLTFEIKSALDHGITVVPVLVDRAKPPGKDDLSPRMASLVDLQAARLDGQSFHCDAEALHTDLNNLYGVRPPPAYRSGISVPYWRWPGSCWFSPRCASPGRSSEWTR
jgi:hypothetical protein